MRILLFTVHLLGDTGRESSVGGLRWKPMMTYRMALRKVLPYYCTSKYGVLRAGARERTVDEGRGDHGHQRATLISRGAWQDWPNTPP